MDQDNTPATAVDLARIRLSAEKWMVDTRRIARELRDPFVSRGVVLAAADRLDAIVEAVTPVKAGA